MIMEHLTGFQAPRGYFGQRTKAPKGVLVILQALIRSPFFAQVNEPHLN